MEKPVTEAPAEPQTNPEVRDKKEKRKQEDKKIKHERPAEFERNDKNADLITEDTVLEPLPKKTDYLKRPELKEFQDRETVNRDKVANLIKKKKQIFEEKFKPSRVLVKGEAGTRTQLQEEIEEFGQLKERFVEAKNLRNEKRDLITKLIEEAKQNNANLKKLKQLSKNSREYFEDLLDKYEQRLITADLTKQEEKTLNTEIQATRRKIKDAQAAGNIEEKIERAKERKEQLDVEIDKLKEEKEPLENECKELKQKMDAKNEQITKLKGDIKTEKDQKTEAKEKNDKEYEDWKENKKKRIDEINKKIKEIDELTKKIWEEYNTKNDAYWEQKHRFDFLEWQYKVKDRKIRDKEREKRREIAIEREKEREKAEQLQKYSKEIELCNFLMKYLKDLVESTQEKPKEEKKAEEPVDVNSKLGEDSQWKKEKGLVVLQSKKSREDEEPVKKGKKQKKKNDKEETNEKKFEIPFNIEGLFEQLRLLAPRSWEEVEGKLKELRERELLFERASSEEVSEADKAQIENIKGEAKKEKKQQKKVQNAEDEFPTL